MAQADLKTWILGRSAIFGACSTARAGSGPAGEFVALGVRCGARPDESLADLYPEGLGGPEDVGVEKPPVVGRRRATPLRTGVVVSLRYLDRRLARGRGQDWRTRRV